MYYSGISECDVLNGTGFRVVLFVSGCDHKCHGCHNPETWNEKFGHLYTEETKIYILDCLSKDYIDGITITGGDPLYKHNRLEVKELIYTIKILYPNKNIWLYTGYLYEDLLNMNDVIIEDILDGIDILVDGEYKEELRDVSLPFRGSSNQRIINIKGENI